MLLMDVGQEPSPPGLRRFAYLSEVKNTAGHPVPTLPTSTYEMSDAQDPTTVKLGGCSQPGGGHGFLHFRQHQELQAFLNLLEDTFVQEFLSKDPCFRISDKYLLAMVLVYFQRANLKLSEYSHSNLFLALYLANDMEEDLEEAKCEIFPWALGKDWCLRVGRFLHQRDLLWARMGFRAVVSRQCCEEVMAKEPFHWAWARERRAHHGGVQRGCPQVSARLPRGPGLSPPHCSLCGLSQHPSHHRPKPVLSDCSVTWEYHHPGSQNCLSEAKSPWGGDLLVLLPPQMQLESGIYPFRNLTSRFVARPSPCSKISGSRVALPPRAQPLPPSPGHGGPRALPGGGSALPHLAWRLTPELQPQDDGSREMRVVAGTPGDWGFPFLDPPGGGREP
ncbi:speedy protein C [Carlito syrichta]|uniref:Speedy protein C n=1 Tax=Carlito syrichta TaxID=1868482 RepID=A0A1U7TT47_CARSF|nr:speedy protein C [Carlito syrichta]